MTNFSSKEGEVAFQHHQAIIKNENERRRLLIENMEHIYELHSSGLYKAVLGDENAPWSAYLGQHEVFYSKSKILIFDGIYRKYIKELGLDVNILVDIPISKLNILCGIVDKENVREWLEKARALTNQDFNDEIRISQGKVSYLDCSHEQMNEYEICSDCGFRHKKDAVEK